MSEESSEREIPVIFPDAIRGGVYSNTMVVRHTREEFVLDFMMVVPPAGAVTARVITSPGHMKRMISMLIQTLKNHEEKHGMLEEAAEPPRHRMGFQTPSARE